MKPFLRLSAAVLLAASPVFAADQSLLGKISDACAAKPGAAPAADCKGPKYVFTARGKTYTITNPDFPGLADRVDRLAKMTGAVNGDTFTIKSIAEGHPPGK